MTKTRADIAVIGSGSWATGIVKMLTENCSKIAWYIREPEIIEHLNLHNHNPRYLSSVDFEPEKLFLTNDINEAVDASDTVILVVPSAFLKSALADLKSDLSNKTICSAIKGIIPDENMIVGEFLNKKYNVSYENLVILSGPTHAEEIAMEKLSYLTVASLDENVAKSVSVMLQTFYLKTVISDDIFGIEYAAVLKNIYAIAVGLAHGLGYGDNFQAVLLSNAAAEMRTFVAKVYKNDRDILASAYLGDLLVTGYSQFSRNRMFGNMIGKGSSVRYALLNMIMVAEGYYATDCINKIIEKVGANLPIAEAVYRVLYKESNPSKEMKIIAEHLI